MTKTFEICHDSYYRDKLLGDGLFKLTSIERKSNMATMPYCSHGDKAISFPEEEAMVVADQWRVEVYVRQMLLTFCKKGEV